MAKIEKSEESGPQLFFNFTWKYVSQLFLRPPWAEKMTFSQKTGRVWFDDTYPLNHWHVLSGKVLVSPFDQFVKHHFGSTDMCGGKGLPWRMPGGPGRSCSWPTIQLVGGRQQQLRGFWWSPFCLLLSPIVAWGRGPWVDPVGCTPWTGSSSDRESLMSPLSLDPLGSGISWWCCATSQPSSLLFSLPKLNTLEPLLRSLWTVRFALAL